MREKLQNTRRGVSEAKRKIVMKVKEEKQLQKSKREKEEQVFLEQIREQYQKEKEF